MIMLASQITSLTVVYSTVYSDVNQRKHQSSASLAFVWEIHRGPVNFPHKGPVTRKMFPFDDVIMYYTIYPCYLISHGFAELNRDTSQDIYEILSDVDNSPTDEVTPFPTFERSLGFYRCIHRGIGILTRQSKNFTDRKISITDLQSFNWSWFRKFLSIIIPGIFHFKGVRASLAI